jgi:tRNA(Glu) U13 pseudouridine synthase TruD
VGYRVTLPEGEPLTIEQDVFAAAGLKPDDFKHAGKQSAKGARRPLRVKPADLELSGGADDHGPFVALSFTLPAGSFATVLLGEVMKGSSTKSQEESAEDADAEEEAADLTEE